MLVPKSLAVLIAGRVDDVLVLRRLLRETSYRVDGVTGATQALRAITQHSYSAVVADDDQIQGLSGAKSCCRTSRSCSRVRCGCSSRRANGGRSWRISR